MYQAAYGWEKFQSHSHPRSRSVIYAISNCMSLKAQLGRSRIPLLQKYASPESFHPTHVPRRISSHYTDQAHVDNRRLDRINMDWVLVTSVTAISLLTLLTWRRYFSAISDIPGPFAASFTRVWHMDRILKGDQNLELIRLHEQHGKRTRYAAALLSMVRSQPF